MKRQAELLRTSVFGLCLAFTATAWAQPESRPPLDEPACVEPCVEKLATGPHILTALGPVFSVTEPLLAGTPYEVGIVPASGPRTLQSQLTLFTRQADDFSEAFALEDGDDAVFDPAAPRRFVDEKGSDPGWIHKNLFPAKVGRG